MQAPPQGRVLVRKTMQAIRDTMLTARNHVRRFSETVAPRNQGFGPR